MGRSSRVFLVWYIGGVVEIALHLSFSQLSHVLTFLGTHLGERLNLLTLVILGEGCIILAKSITLVVKDTFVKDINFNMWSMYHLKKRHSLLVANIIRPGNYRFSDG